MNPRYEIQGRLIARRNGAIVRDDVRLATATEFAEATLVAGEFVADGFTVWVFAVESGRGLACRYRQIARMSPTPAPSAGRARPAESASTCAA